MVAQLNPQWHTWPAATVEDWFARNEEARGEQTTFVWNDRYIFLHQPYGWGIEVWEWTKGHGWNRVRYASNVRELRQYLYFVDVIGYEGADICGRIGPADPFA